METIKPMHDRVVVERLEADGKTAGGLVLPDSAREKPRQGTVIASGPGRVLDTGAVSPVDVKKGDRILFGGFAGSEIKLNGKEYLILSENEILAVLNEGK